MEQFINLIPQLATLITSCSVILVAVKKWLVEPTNKKIEAFELSSIKTDLVNFINDAENGIEKSDIQRLNAHELYDRYKKLGGNSYVHDHFEKLLKEGKI